MMEPVGAGDALRLALRGAARSVTIVSCQWHCEDLAATVIAFCEVSLEPPTIMVCVDRRSRLAEPLQMGTPFCVNLLADHQSAAAAVCGGQLRDIDRFSIGRWLRREQGQVPYLGDAQATLFCTAASALTWGTHAVILAKVDAVVSGAGTTPLLYADGRYHALGAERTMAGATH